MSTRGRVEVAGAGLAGLTVATALARRGWSARVNERGRELREIGARKYLRENALRGLEAVDEGVLPAASSDLGLGAKIDQVDSVYLAGREHYRRDAGD